MTHGTRPPRTRSPWPLAPWPVRLFAWLTLAGSVALLTPRGWAQDNAPAASGITLNFPENAPLTTLVAYVSERLDLNILYDEAQLNQQVTLRTPSPIPETALLDLLSTVLATRSLVLQDTAVPGLMRIVPAQQLPEVAKLAQAGDGANAGAVTQVFALKHVRAERVLALIVPFVTKPGGNVAVLPEEQFIIVTDYASNLKRLADLIERIDTPRGGPMIRSITLEHADATELLKVVQPLIQGQARAGNAPQAAQAVMIASDARTNQLLVVGPADQVESVAALVASLDVASDLERKVYRPQVVPPDRLDALITAVLSPEPTKYSYRAAADISSGTLVVTAPPTIHAQIASLLEKLDALPPIEQETVHFYKLTNTVAEDVLQTIRMLEGESTTSTSQRQARDRPPLTPFMEQVLGGSDAAAAPYDNSAGSGLPPTPQVSDGQPPSNGTPMTQTPPPADSAGQVDPASSLILQADAGERRPTIAADRNTNTIIVVAPPALQKMYAQIIERLDQRRPQVLIETTIVALDTSDHFELGVEIGFSERGSDGRIISFSAFGLSDLNPTTGRLTPIAAPGGTLALLSPDIADVVIRALSSNDRARLVSMPRILVNDNELGQLRSNNVEPYATTVISDGTVLVGQSGQAEAGTSILVTPHISEGDYLQLEYAVELSSFTGQRQPNLPPPSQVNVIESRVTIPDGHTIVVGGLNRSDLRETITKVPLLGDIPLIKYLFQHQLQDVSNITLFVFIRPTILRDDQFRGLKHLSGLDRETAGVEDDFPRSEPLLMDPLP